MNIRFFNQALPVLLLASTLLAGCRTRKPQPELQYEKSITLQSIRDSVAAHPVDFRKLSFKGDGETDGPDKGMDFAFNYKLRVRHDSVVWCSINKFGLEFVQGIVTTDSLKMRTAMPAEARVCDLNFLQKALGFAPDFKMLEAVLTGRPLLEGDSVELVNVERLPWIIKTRKGGYELNHYFMPGPFHVEKIVLNKPGTEGTTTLSYSDFRPTPAGLLPFGIGVTLERNGMLSTFSLTHSTVTVNGENTTFDFRIPDSYPIKRCNEK